MNPLRILFHLESMLVQCRLHNLNKPCAAHDPLGNFGTAWAGTPLAVAMGADLVVDDTDSDCRKGQQKDPYISLYIIN